MGRQANYPSTPATNALGNLRSVAPYHPLTVETFGDWAVEAGDKVTVTRGDKTYTSPVHETKLVWKGQPEVELISTGSEERVPIGKMEKRKYSSGRGGLRDSWRLYNFEVNQHHLLYDVYNDYYGRLHACIEVTSSKMKAKMEDWYNGLMAYMEFTASHLLVQFWGLYDGLSSQLELTRSALTVQFLGLYDGLRSDLELTRSRLKLEFDDAYNGLYSGLEMTASRLRIWFTGLYDGLNSELEMTRSRLYVHFWGLYDGLSGELEMTRSRFWLGFNGLYDGLHGELEMTRSRFGLAFDGLYDGLHGELEMTRSRFAVAFDGLYDGLHGELEMTRSRFHVEFMGLYDGLRGELDLTRSRFGVAFDGLYDGLHGELEMTRSRFALQFDGLYDGLYGEMEMTRSRLYAGFMGLYDGLRGDLSMTRSQLLVQFSGMYDGLDSRLEVTRSQFSMQISNYYSGLSSRVEQTASSWSAIVDSDGNIKPAKIQAAINKATGNSKIKLSADHIELDGSVISSYLEGNSIGVQSIMADEIILNGGGKLLFYQDSEIGDSEAANLIVDAYVDENNSNLLHLIHYDGTDTTFSKAVTSKVTGTWSDGVYTVSADPNGQNLPIATTIGKRGESWNNNVCTVSIGYEDPINDQWIYTGKSITVTVPLTDDWSGRTHRVKINGSVVKQGIVYDGLVPTGNITKSGKTVYRDFIVYSDDGAGNADSIILQKNVGINASDVWNDGYDQARTYSNAPTTGNTSSASMSVKTPKADRTGYDTTTYTVSVDSSYAYIKTNVNGTNVTIARTANTASTPVYYLQESWGTGNDSNKLLIGRTTSGNTTSFTHTITADATLSYNSTTHKYTATGKAKVDGSEKDSDTDTESTAQGYLDGWKDCYDTLDTTGTTATKTLSAGEQAVVSVKQKNKDGSVITRLSRTYTAPNPTITIYPSSVSPLDPGGSVTITAKKDGVEVSGQSVTVSARGIDESDISFRTSNFGEYSASVPSGYNTTSPITLSKATGYYTMVVDMTGNSTGKWYKVYIDASALADSSVSASDISIKNWAYYSPYEPSGSGWHAMPANLSITNTTGYYKLVVSAKGTEKWYKVYMDARPLYRDGWDYAAGKVHFYAYQSWVGGPARRGMSVNFPQTHTETYTYPDTTQYFWLYDDTTNHIVRLYKGDSTGSTTDEMCNIEYNYSAGTSHNMSVQTKFFKIGNSPGTTNVLNGGGISKSALEVGKYYGVGLTCGGTSKTVYFLIQS